MQFIEDDDDMFPEVKPKARRKAPKKRRPAPDCILDALDRVQEGARGSKLTDKFWKEYEMEFNYLTERTGLTKEEAVIIGAMCEIGDAVSWRRLASFFGLSRLRMMNYASSTESLKQRRWIRSCIVSEMRGRCQGFHIIFGVVKALREDHPFEPERIDGLTEQQFVERIGIFLSLAGGDNDLEAEEKNRMLMQLVEANPDLPICKKINSLAEESSKVLFMIVVGDYARCAETPNEGVHFRQIMDWFDNPRMTSDLLDSLRDEENELFTEKLVEFKCCDGLVDPEVLCVSSETRHKLLSEYVPKFNKPQHQSRDIIKYESIKEKKLFFNEADRSRIERLGNILSGDTLTEIRGRLRQKGMRQGIACLFYGAPGTGKTETVLQLARESGRDVMQVDISAMRDKYVGESEKNIRSVFTRYRHLCDISDATPILLFNEADAIFGNRFESVNSSIEKMDNAMQNIILEEMEKLNGILFATTNLTGNLDRAFDRRFLFKVEFSRPEADTRSQIWGSMMPDLSEADTKALALEFELSGGQIENVARKSSIEWILSGVTPDLATLRDFCREERLNRTNRPRIGF